MSGGEEPRRAAFNRSYAAALREYLEASWEGSLTIAYELGRVAVKQGLSVLELAVAYQEALASELAAGADHGGLPALTQRAGEFFLESLSSFEMLHRGAGEARGSVAEYRRRARLSRQLSTFLTDSSLLGSPDSLDEMLQLASDQGREILDVDCCLVTLAAHDSPREAEAVSHPEPDADWQFTRWLDLPRIYRLLEHHGHVHTLVGDDAAQLSLSGATDTDQPIRSWLGASLTALDGAQLGALQMFDRRDRDFGHEDEAALVQLAQMVSGTVERMRLHRQRRRR